MKKSTVKLNSKSLSKVLLQNSVDAFTDRLIKYAIDTTRKIGKAIQLRGGANNMDRTGNLLNSLCWGVSYRGTLKGSGFYREANSLQDSYIHEWGKYKDMYPVYGHMYAEEYISEWGAGFETDQGWRVFFAILAPYWGYWEEGFKMRGRRGTKFMRFWVMTRFYDTVVRDLKPTKHHLKVYVPTYSHKSLESRNESFLDKPHKQKWREKHRKRNNI